MWLPLLALAAAMTDEPSIDGRWVNPSGSVIIDIAPCGDMRCGTVRWASEQAKEDARKGTDQLVGSNLLTDLQRKRLGEWRGRLFIPDQRMRVKAKLNLMDGGRLKVSGCALVCRSQLWTRSDAELPD